MSDSFDRMWAELAPIGRNRTTGGYRRYSWEEPDAEMRSWFIDSAVARGMETVTDRNGNIWAWWGTPGPGAVVTGSHLDSVPDGGAYDGPLGIVSAFAAVDALQQRELPSERPLAVVAFVEEEGARFGVPCLGTRLLTGAITPDRAAGLTDTDGITWARAMENAGLDATRIGADTELVTNIAAFVELHIEQGKGLFESPVGVASAVWPHGRWRMDFAGRADHAGTTRITDRSDPMVPFARCVLAAREVAEATSAVATVGKARVWPNGTNAIPSRVRAWLDARAPDEATLREVTDAVDSATQRSSTEEGVFHASYLESYTPVVEFATELRDRVAHLAGGAETPAPILPTGAGHDAGVLAASVPTAMLFVRNPTGVSHAPMESAEPADCHAGVAALTEVLTDLLTDGT